MTGLHKIYIQSGLPWIHAQYSGSQYRAYIAKNTRAIQRIRAQYREYTRNTGKPRVRAIDGSHGVWPRPPLPNRKIGNYPDYFRFWAERAIIAIISDHCRWTENFFIGQQWVDNKLLTGICGGDWWPVSNCDDWMGGRKRNIRNIVECCLSAVCYKSHYKQASAVMTRWLESHPRQR